MTLVMLTQIMGNQFGFDRAGFRIFVLSPAPCGEILLGKNLAAVPLIVLMIAPILVLMQFFIPMRLDHLLGCPGQFVSMFLLFCLWGNSLSILADADRRGELEAGQCEGICASVSPALSRPGAGWRSARRCCHGAEVALASLDLHGGVPICLILTYVECAVIIAVYRVALGWQGRWLERRELRILETVTAKVE